MPDTTPLTYRAYTATDTEGSYSIINEWLTMKGDLESEGDILVRGKVHGNIRCKMLIIDPSAMIEGGIIADEVVVRGTTRGIIKAKRVRLEKTANVDSEIFHDTFSAEEGAKIKGALRSNEELNARVSQMSDGGERKASSLYQMLDGARGASHPRLTAVQ